MFVKTRAHMESITVSQIHTITFTLILLSAVRVPAAQASTPPNTIRLKGVTIDTSAGTDVRAQAPALAGSSGRHVIQLNGPMTRTRRSRLEDAGAVLEGYLPVNAFIVKLDQADAGKLAELGFIRWTGPFQDAWKLNPFLGQRVVQSPERIALDQQGLIQVMIVLFPGENAEAIAADLAARGANVLAQTLSGTRWYIDATIPRIDVARLAEMAAVQFVQEAPEVALGNNSNRWIVQSDNDTSQATPVWDAGIHGEGQVFGLIDRLQDARNGFLPAHQDLMLTLTLLGPTVGFVLEPCGKNLYDRLPCRGQATFFRGLQIISKTRGT
ncbi:MAG: hypothetical protein IIC02_02495 [Planctomycetes bacterium]|nr:hypothetical protein [Planctomycetota bacterium]